MTHDFGSGARAHPRRSIARLVLPRLLLGPDAVLFVVGLMNLAWDGGIALSSSPRRTGAVVSG